MYCVYLQYISTVMSIGAQTAQVSFELTQMISCLMHNCQQGPGQFYAWETGHDCPVRDHCCYIALGAEW